LQKEWQDNMDKILSRKLFRQKYLDLVGVKNLPKFAVGGNMGNVDMSDYKQGNQGIMAALNPSQDQLAAMNTKLEEASTPKKTTSNETFMGFGGEGSAVSADQARLNILLPIAAQLMTGTVRPGQSSISGLIESAGKGLSTVGTNILAMKEMDLKKRKEDREANKTGALNTSQMYDTLQQKTLPVPYALIAADTEGRYQQPSPKTQSFMVAEDGIVVDPSDPTKFLSKGETHTFTGDVVRQFTKKYGSLILNPKGDLELTLEMQGKRKEQDLEKVRIDKAEIKGDGVLNLLTSSRRAYDLSSAGAEGGVLGSTLINVDSFYEGVKRSIYGNDQTRADFEAQEKGIAEKIENGEAIISKGFPSYLDEKQRKIFVGLSVKLRSRTLELAYKIAKAREEGGRFSVTDISMALDAIGSSSNPEVFKAALMEISMDLATSNLIDLQGAYDCSGKEQCTKVGMPNRYLALFDHINSLQKGIFPDITGISLPDAKKSGESKEVDKEYLK